MDANWATYESPLGPLTLVARGGGLRQLRFPGRGARLSEELHRPQDADPRSLPPGPGRSAS